MVHTYLSPTPYGVSEPVVYAWAVSQTIPLCVNSLHGAEAGLAVHYLHTCICVCMCVCVCVCVCVYV